MGNAFQPGGRSAAPAPLVLVQDFVNTEIPEWQRDDIATPPLLAGWLAARGLVPVGSEADGDSFVVARELRGGLRELALAHTLDQAPTADARAALDVVLARLPIRFALGGSAAVRVVPIGRTIESALAAIVAIVLEAEHDGTWSRLKACRKDSCGWVFYDGSRNRSSSWCSMQICGNRVKARAARERRASRTGSG